jgi:type I restriction enzyme M protein
LIVNCAGYNQIKKSYHERLDGVWEKCLESLNDLPNQNSIQGFVECIRNVYINDMYDDEYPVINLYQGRGAIAQFFTDLKYDFMSVVSSGWNAELIPEDEILGNQFPEVLKELRDAEARRDEIQAQFDSANEMEKEEGWIPEEFDLSCVEVIPKSVIKLIKDDIKKHRCEKRAMEKDYKNIEKRIKAYEKDLAKVHDPHDIGEVKVQIAALEQNKTVLNNQIQEDSEYIEEQETKIKTHTDLEEELKECRKIIREITLRKDKLVEEAREKITDEEAEKLIIARWNKTLHSIVDAYIEEFARNLQLDIEHIYEKYTVTLKDILSDRDKVTADLNKYLEELGYAL